MSLCATLHPLYTIFTDIIGTSFLKRECDRTLGAWRTFSGNEIGLHTYNSANNIDVVDSMFEGNTGVGYYLFGGAQILSQRSPAGLNASAG